MMLHFVLRFLQGMHAFGRVSAANRVWDITNRSRRMGLARRPAFVGPLESRRGRGAVTRPGRGDAIRLWHFGQPWPRMGLEDPRRRVVGLSCISAVPRNVTVQLIAQSLLDETLQHCRVGSASCRQVT